MGDSNSCTNPCAVCPAASRGLQESTCDARRVFRLALVPYLVSRPRRLRYDPGAMDHDQLFKELLRTFFLEFLDLFLPEVSAFVEREGIEFLDKEIFTDITAGERHEVDMLVKVRFRGQETFFLIHIETQATATSGFGRRFFRYFARIHDKHDLPVYPIVLFSYDTPQRPEPEAYRVTFPDRTVLDFQFRVIQLNRLNWRDFLRQPNPVAAALMTKMKIAPEDRPRVKLEILRMMLTLKLDPARQTLIRGFMSAYLRLSGEELRVYNQQVTELEPAEREATMNIISEWEEIGEARGEARGRAEIILRLLRRRLGEISTEVEKRVQDLPPEKADLLADKLLDFGSLSDAEAWLVANA